MYGTFEQECQVIRLYYENAEANILNDLFFETADGSTMGEKIDHIKDKVVQTIDEIIEKIKEFFTQIHRKYESAKVKQMLRSEACRSKKLIKAEIHDKEITKAVAAIMKIENKAFADARKLYDQFMSHKINYETYCDKVEDVYENAAETIEKVKRDMDDVKLINPDSAKGAYTIEQLAKRVGEFETVYTRTVQKMNDEIVAEENKIRAAAAKVVVDNMAASATSKLSSILSKINKKAVMAVISVVGITSAAGLLYHHGKNAGAKKAGATYESAEDDYFSDMLEDDESYDESAGDSEFDYSSIWEDLK